MLNSFDVYFISFFNSLKVSSFDSETLTSFLWTGINLYLILLNISVNKFDCVVNLLPYIACNYTIFCMINLLPFFLFSLILGNSSL